MRMEKKLLEKIYLKKPLLEHFITLALSFMEETIELKLKIQHGEHTNVILEKLFPLKIFMLIALKAKMRNFY